MNIEALAARYYTSLKTTCADLRTISAERRTSCQKVIILLQVITFPIVVIPLELCRLVARVTRYCCNRQKESAARVATPILGSTTSNGYAPVDMNRFPAVTPLQLEELNKICSQRQTAEALESRGCPFAIGADPGVRGVEVAVIAKDIFQSEAQALVCPSHANLKPGCRLDRQFFDKAGSDYQAQLAALRNFFNNQCPPDSNNQCPQGVALSLPTDNLILQDCRSIILVPAPLAGERNFLYSVYYNALMAASALNLQSIAFPPISTGTNGFDKDDAARIAVRAIHDFKKENPGSSINRISIHDSQPNWYQNYIKPATAPGGPLLSLI